MRGWRETDQWQTYERRRGRECIYECRLCSYVIEIDRWMERERKRERKRESKKVCVRERERERER